jgi:hypothetical protein
MDKRADRHARLAVIGDGGKTGYCERARHQHTKDVWSAR